jgi:hypothetical protein
MDLTKGQRELVEYLIENDKFTLTSTQFAHHLNKKNGNEDWTPSRVHSAMSRLEKRGITWRNKTIPGYWRLTIAARRAYRLGGFNST